MATYLIDSLRETEVCFSGQFHSSCQELLSDDWREGGKGVAQYWQKSSRISIWKAETEEGKNNQYQVLFQNGTWLHIILRESFW